MLQSHRVSCRHVTLLKALRCAPCHTVSFCGQLPGHGRACCVDIDIRVPEHQVRQPSLQRWLHVQQSNAVHAITSSKILHGNDAAKILHIILSRAIVNMHEHSLHVIKWHASHIINNCRCAHANQSGMLTERYVISRLPLLPALTSHQRGTCGRLSTASHSHWTTTSKG